MKKSTIISVALLAAAAIAAFIVLRRKDPHEARSVVVSGEPPPFVPVAKDSVDELDITEAAQGKVRLVRKDSVWRLEEPFQDRANVDNVRQALEGLEVAVFKQPVANSKAALDKLGCTDEKGVHVVARTAGKVVADFYVCSEMNRVRSGMNSQVWEARELDRFRFVKGGAKEWRDLTIAEVPTPELSELAITTAGSQVRLRRIAPAKPDGGEPTGTDTWELISATPPIVGLDHGQANLIAARLSRLSGSDVANVDAAAAGLDQPSGTVEATMSAGGSTKLVFGKSEGPDIYVQRAGDPRVFTLAKTAADELLVTGAKLGDKAVTGLAPGDITALELTAAGEKASLVKDGETWKATLPKGLVVDGAKVAMLASKLESLRASALAPAGTPAKDTKLDKPDATVTLTTKDGRKQVVRIGGVKDGSRHVARAGAPALYLVADAELADLVKKPSEALK